MNTFKAYLRIIQQRPTYILIQLGIFIAMVFILNAQAPSTSSEVSDVRMFIGFYFEEGAPHAIDPLIEDLKKDNHTVYDEVKSEVELKQLMFDSLITTGCIVQKDGRIRSIQQNMDGMQFIVEEKVDTYLQLERFLEKHNVSNPQNEAFRLSQKKVAIELLEKPSEVRYQLLSIFYNFAAYASLMTLFMIMVNISESFEEPKMKVRMMISSTPYTKIERDLLLSHGVVTVLLFFLVLVAAVINYGTELVFSPNGVQLMVNLFVYLICNFLLCFLLSRVITNQEVGQKVGNVLGLGLAFMSGIFVPAHYLDPRVLKVARVFPMAWIVDANARTIENDGSRWQPMAVLALMALVYIVLIRVVGHKQIGNIPQENK